MTAAVRDHPRLQDVAPSLLAREGLVPFYETCGFEVASASHTLTVTLNPCPGWFIGGAASSDSSRSNQY